MKKTRIMLHYFKYKKNIILENFTLAKFTAALFTIILVALLRYSIYGGFIINNLYIINNIAIGLLAWTVNTGMISLLTDYLGIKGINFNLKQFIFGFHTLKIDGECLETNKVKKRVKKFCNAMESHGDSDSHKPLDKGKGIDWGQDEVEARSHGRPLEKGKGKGVDWREAEIKRFEKWNAFFSSDKKPKVLTPDEVEAFNKSRGVKDPSFPRGINPGPGFNVPGGEVPIRDEICKHIDYNTHILSQYKRMDLETAREQRSNYLLHLKILSDKRASAENFLRQIPAVPTNEAEFKLKNQILSDLDHMDRDRIRLEARATLINSRVEFIENSINKN